MKTESQVSWGRVGIAVGILGALFAVSCATTRETASIPPEIEGAEFTGNRACAECHEAIHRDSPSSPHGRHYKDAGIRWASMAGCESCHGPGSRHVASGLPAHIVNPGRNPQTCLRCHQATHTEFLLPHHHRVLEGRMSCVDCHEPHGRDIHQPADGLGLAFRDATCVQCHREQAHPHVFEHEALREGCVTCHSPHGSMNRGMLVQRDANLCLRCHAQIQAGGGQLFIGKMDHSQFLGTGTCWSAGCHTAVHGSNFSPRLLY